MRGQIPVESDEFKQDLVNYIGFDRLVSGRRMILGQEHQVIFLADQRIICHNR